jgi:hypothetical protein
VIRESKEEELKVVMMLWLPDNLKENVTQTRDCELHVEEASNKNIISGEKEREPLREMPKIP